MDRRKKSIPRPSPLPKDYLMMVSDVFTSHFEVALKSFSKLRTKPYFSTSGEVFSDEVVLAVSLCSQNELSCTTVYASCDFDPKASSPTVQDLLSCCVDAVGTVFEPLLNSHDPSALKRLAGESLGDLENVPFEWTETESNQRRIFVKIDKSNLKVDELTDEWLRKNDPEIREIQDKEEKETEALFFTGPRKK